jgi:hypothetical protein
MQHGEAIHQSCGPSGRSALPESMKACEEVHLSNQLKVEQEVVGQCGSDAV